MPGGNPSSQNIVTSNIEHNAVSRSIKRLVPQGFATTAVSVDSRGRVDPAEVADAIRDDT
ncbi:MAG: hypothetical protein ACLFPD_03780 [Desulfosudaceae bacterium]